MLGRHLNADKRLGIGDFLPRGDGKKERRNLFYSFISHPRAKIRNLFLNSFFSIRNLMMPDLWPFNARALNGTKSDFLSFRRPPSRSVY